MLDFLRFFYVTGNFAGISVIKKVEAVFSFHNKISILL